MALPKNLADLLKAKEEFLAKAEKDLQKSVKTAQIKYFNDLIEALVGQIETDVGVIRNSTNNMKIMDALIELHDKFSKSTLFDISKQMAVTFSKLSLFSDKYFATLPMSNEMRTILRGAVKKAKQLMSYRVGISAQNGKLLKNGFLQRFIEDTSVRQQVQQLTMRYVTGQGEFKSFVNELRDMILGDENKDGAVEKYYKTYAYDSYSEYDNAYSESIASDVGLRAFIYQGGIMESTRLFCEEHNNHVYTRAEAETWPQWTPSQAEYHDFSNEKNANKVPSYIKNYPGYQPLINLGGFNCRHYLTWISDEMAIGMRPELADIFANEQ
jgi:hypothetical protein